MEVSAKVSVTSKGSIDAWLRKMQPALKPATVDIGLVAGQARGDVIMYGIYNHEGTSRGIPSRPFVKVAFHRYQGAARAELRSGLRAALNGTPFKASAAKAGAVGVKWVQGVIDSNLGPPLAASTVARKGNSRTLIDTGTMRGSITFKVR